MINYEEKFIVLNSKHLQKLYNEAPISGFLCLPTGKNVQVIEQLKKALDAFHNRYKKVFGKELNQKYYVVNQDEPYADKVLDLILEGERVKQEDGK